MDKYEPNLDQLIEMMEGSNSDRALAIGILETNDIKHGMLLKKLKKKGYKEKKNFWRGKASQEIEYYLDLSEGKRVSLLWDNISRRVIVYPYLKNPLLSEMLRGRKSI